MKHKVNVRKWGNSLGFRIPHQIASELNLADGSALSLSKNGEQLIVEKEQVLPTLDDILDSIPENFTYPDDVSDFTSSEPKGREVL